MKFRKVTAFVLSMILGLSLLAVPAGAADKISVKCGSIAGNGKLKTACAATRAGGKNQTPAVSWEAVPSANYYAVYMLDSSANYWCHWKALVKTTSLKQGENPGKYVGPYPPSGTHNYRIYVFALKSNPGNLPGSFDAKNSLSTITNGLSKGTILAQGYTTAKYAHGDNNK